MGAPPVSFQRHVWIDTLRLFAGLSMVGLHVTADPAGMPFADVAPADRVFPMLLRAVLYTARTELFLMISVLLLVMAQDRRPRAYGETIHLQALRLVPPFLFWTAFYAAFGLIKADSFGYLDSALSQLSNPFSWLRFLLLGDVKYHMHFIPTLFGLLLFFPLFKVAQRQPMWGVSVLALLLIKRHLDAYIYTEFWGTDQLPYLVRAVKIATYVGYGMAAGAVLGIWQTVSSQARQQWVPIILLLGGLLFTFKLISTQTVIQSGAWDYSYEPGYWADFLMPVVLLVLFMCLAERDWPEGIARVSKYAFGIYLCHPIFLDLAEVALKEIALSPTSQILLELTWTIPTTCLFVFVLSRQTKFAWTIGLGPLPYFGVGEIKSHLK